MISLELYTPRWRIGVGIAIVLIGALVGASYLSACAGTEAAASEGNSESQNIEEPSWEAMHPDEYRAAILASAPNYDTILSLYRVDESQPEVLRFFVAVAKSKSVAEAILKYAEEYDVAPSLAFAVAWEESRFDPRAVNRNKSSVDRGLFQLNSKSFPNVTEQEFFDPAANARYGVAHLRWCLDIGGTDVAALAMYNAGTSRVRSTGAPKATLDYIARILEFRSGVDSLFSREVAAHWLLDENGAVLSLAPIRPRTGANEVSSAFRLPPLRATP